MSDTSPSNSEQSPTNGTTQPTAQRPMRAMLARGAACDLCRSRKVKCDGLHPVCSQCTKSARGNTDLINCVYEGGRIKKAGSGAPRKSSGSANGTAGSKKREREKSSTGEDEDDQDDGDDDQGAELERRESEKAAAAKDAGRVKKKPATSGGGGQRVDQLVERISELERRLRMQSALPTALHTHPRSPPISYALSSSSSYPFPPSSVSGPPGLDMRRSFSSSTADEVGVSEIAKSWTPESNIRFTAPGPSDRIPTPVGAGTGWSPPPSQAYASFIPSTTLNNSDTRSTSETANEMAGACPMDNYQNTVKTFPGGSSYPPLNYTPPAQQQPSPSNEYGNLFNAMSQAPTSNYGSQLPTNTFDYLDPSSYQLPNTNNVNGSSSSSSSFPPSQPTSLAPSPEEPFALDASLLQILYPSWPASLPLPSTVHHLVTVFFTRATVPSTMLNRGRFLAALDKAPDSPGFPHIAILHAICAYASAWVSSETLGGDVGGRKYWEKENSPKEYHYKEARKAIEKGLLGAHNQLQVLQAIILCSYMAYFSASFSELWLLSGQATRLCTPLGLNHLPPWDFATNVLGDKLPDWRAAFHSLPNAGTVGLLPDVVDIEEHWERAATFWMAFSIDRHASAATAWSTSIDELDITTHLPCISSVPVPCSSLSITDPNFLHEVSPTIGSFGLYLKAVVLLGRVVNYLQRLPKLRSLPEGETCTTLREKWKAEPIFKELDLALAKFRTMTSNDFFNAGSFVDGHLASAYAIPHAASILLHEPFCDRFDRSPTSSLARCLTSAKCVVNSTYVLYQSNNDLSGLDPFIGYCWSVVGRALVRDHAVRTLWNDMESAAFSKQLAEHVLSFTGRCKKTGAVVPILSHMHDTLRSLLDNPTLLLPPDGDGGECASITTRMEILRNGMQMPSDGFTPPS